MKQLKTTLIVMLLCLIFIDLIQEVKSETLESLFYSNEESFGKPNSKKSSIISNRKSEKNFKTKNLKLSNNLKYGKNLNSTKKNKMLNLKKMPIGLNYLPVPGNNVYLHSINFFVRLMKGINDSRDFTTLSKKISAKCHKVNIFKTLRESILNCKVITKKLKDNKPVIKVFNLGCMANIVQSLQDACPHFEKKSSNVNLTKAINLLSQVPNNLKKKLEIIARIFVKRLSFTLRIFPRHILQRIAEVKKLQKERRKQKKLALKNNGVSQDKNKKINNKKAKKKKEITIEELLRKGKSKKNSNKGQNKNLIEKNIVKKNSKADKEFVKISGLNSSKSMTIASFIAQYVLKIASL